MRCAIHRLFVEPLLCVTEQAHPCCPWVLLSNAFDLPRKPRECRSIGEPHKADTGPMLSLDVSRAPASLLLSAFWAQFHVRGSWWSWFVALCLVQAGVFRRRRLLPSPRRGLFTLFQESNIFLFSHPVTPPPGIGYFGIQETTNHKGEESCLVHLLKLFSMSTTIYFITFFLFSFMHSVSFFILFWIRSNFLFHCRDCGTAAAYLRAFQVLQSGASRWQASGGTPTARLVGPI